MARVRSPVGSAAGGALALLILLSLAAPARAQAPARAGRVISVQGRVEVERAGAVRPVAVKQDLYPGDLVRTGADSRAAVLLADESQVKLNANSTLRIKAVAPRPARGIIPAALRAGRTLLELIVGEGWFQSPAPPGGLEIETPVVTATIRGTEFDLAVAADGESRLAVLDGRVEYANQLGSLSLGRGELGLARRGQPPQRQVLVDPDDAVQWTLYYPGIVSVRDHPLVSADRAQIESLLARARAEVAAAPADPDRQARLGELLHDLGRREEARAVFAALLAARPDFDRALIGLAWVALEAGRPAEALERLGAVREPTPTSLLGLSLARLRRGELGAAAAALAEARRRFGPSPAILTQSALLDLLRGDVPSARLALAEALRLDPAFALAHGLGSNIALTQNRKDEALAAARRAVEANPHSPSAHLDRSLALQARFDLDGALAAARQAVLLDPDSARPHVQVARLLFGFDRIEEAWESAWRARTLDPGEPLVLTTLGFIRLARGETAEAIVAFDGALDSGDTSGEPYLGLGLAAFRQGRVEEGLRAFQAAALLGPRVSLFLSYLGKALYQVGRREEGLAALRRARELDPRDPTPDLYAGIFLRDLNRPAQAIEAFQRSVALNDHRAVYRSRLLLDRDLASRNVNLALAYLALGQQDRALAAGIRALHEDPQSSSAHLFYGAVVGLGLGGLQPGLSELAQTRLLLPVNQNTFNTFNDYTSLLEQPRLQGTLETTGGSFGTYGGSLSVTGGTTRLAGEQFLSYSSTDGVKPKNDDNEVWGVATFLKWAPTLRSGAYLQLLHQESRGGDITRDQRHFTPNDPDLRQNIQTTFLELGYQIQTRPENNLLLYAQGQLDRFHIRDRDVVIGAIPPFAFPDVALRADQLQDSLFRQPFYDFQAAYLDRLGTHQLWLAADYFRGEPETRLRVQTVADLLLFGAPSGTLTADTTLKQRFRRQFVTVVAQDTWQPWASLYLTGALRYDNARDGDTLSELRVSSSVLSPQGGLLWRLTPAHTLRLAAFQSFQTQSHSVISPTQIAGFFIEGPVVPSSIARQYHAAWDADLTATTFFTLQGFRREIDSPTFETRPDGVRERNTLMRRRTGFSAALNQILGQYFGVSLGYIRVHREGAGEPDGDDDLFRAGVSFVHPSGVLAGSSVAYVRQDRGESRPRGAPRDFSVASVAAGYEFPEKRGRFTVSVENLFRQRFDLRTIPGVRSDLVVSEVPDLRLLATLRLNF